MQNSEVLNYVKLKIPIFQKKNHWGSIKQNAALTFWRGVQKLEFIQIF